MVTPGKVVILGLVMAGATLCIAIAGALIDMMIAGWKRRRPSPLLAEPKNWKAHLRLAAGISAGLFYVYITILTSILVAGWLILERPPAIPLGPMLRALAWSSLAGAGATLLLIPSRDRSGMVIGLLELLIAGLAVAGGVVVVAVFGSGVGSLTRGLAVTGILSAAWWCIHRGRPQRAVRL